MSGLNTRFSVQRITHSDNVLNIGPIVNLTKMMVLHVVGERSLCLTLSSRNSLLAIGYQ